jgi:DNA mismatch repair ATPase MutS
LEYSFLFHGYLENIASLCRQRGQGTVNNCTFVATAKQAVLKDMAYAPLLKDAAVTRNTVTLRKNQIITGPNASGKTTLLKTILLNVIFSQQFGCGYYSKGRIAPYTHFHCYLNIPDTSGRDSLFQAEARRCKEILDAVKSNDGGCRHLCIFDELYSGTNPYEAIASAGSFLEHITRLSNVSFFLTTHFTAVCHITRKARSIANYHMETLALPSAREDDVTEYQYTFKEKAGVSKHRGGISVLRDLGYPKDLVRRAQAIIRSVTI